MNPYRPNEDETKVLWKKARDSGMSRRQFLILLASAGAAAVLAACARKITPTPKPQTVVPTETPTPTPSSPASPSPLPGTKPAPSSTAQAVSLEVVGQIGGPTQAVAVAGNYAYVGVGLRLVVLDFSSPTAPSEVGTSEPFGYLVEDIAVADNIAFVAAGSSGLYTVDISNPARPTILGTYDSPGYAEGVTVVGKYIYLADGPEGLRVIDVTDPAHPKEVAAAYRLNYIFDVAIEGKFAYLAAAGAGLLVADVSDPLKPKEVDSLDTPGYAYGLALSGHTIYVADGWGGLRTIDVSNPTQLKEIGDFDTPGWALDVAVEGNIAYVADAAHGLRILDVSDKSKPKEVGSYEITGSNAIKVAFNKGVVYLVDRSAGLGIFDVTSPAKPVQVGFYNPMGFADAVAVSGNYAYLAAGPYGLRVVDISDLSHPREIGVYETKAYATGIVVIDNYAYVITYSTADVSTGLHIVNVSNPSKPTGASFFAVKGATQDIVVDGNIAYIANEWGLVLVDVSNPTSPAKSGDLDFAQGSEAKAVNATWGVAVSGKTAYVTHGSDGLKAVDVSNPRSPVLTGIYDPASVVKVTAVTTGGHFAYATDHPRLHVVDISNPKDMTEAGFYDLPVKAQRVAFVDNTVYVADAGAGLMALDVSNPQKPVQAGFERLPGYAVGLTAKGNEIYVADGEGGLFIIEDVRKHNEPRQASGSQDVVSGNKALLSVKQVVDKSNLAASAYPSSGRVITVNNPADNGQGTLRYALENASRGDTITFDPSVFSPKNPATIQLTSKLLLTQGDVTIDASNAGVILDGSATRGSESGLYVNSDYNTIKGLQILNFSGNGIVISGANNIVGGDRHRGNGPMGEGNLISGNGYAGITIQGAVVKVGDKTAGARATGNRIVGNFIGTDITGTRAMGNKHSGVFITGSGAYENIVGGKTEAERNVISGNARTEVSLMSQSNGNRIIGNYIGTDADGRVSLGNVALSSVSVELGGYRNIFERNVISNENHIGVIISDWGSWYNEVIGNYIGVDATGAVSLGGKGSGIHINASFNRVGGSSLEERNIISGNADKGVKVGWESTTDIIVMGNYIGTDVTGAKAISNGVGVSIGEGTHRTFIGGLSEGEQNLISGNNGTGVIIQGIGTDFNFITGNRIGTNAAGRTALPNLQTGIEVSGSNNSFIIGNFVAYNKGGIIIKPGENNRLHHNSFIENGKSGDGGNNNYWDNGQEGNYWSEYKGQDKNGDGIGDTPYQVPSNGVDNYPLMKPYEGSLK